MCSSEAKLIFQIRRVIASSLICSQSEASLAPGNLINMTIGISGKHMNLRKKIIIMYTHNKTVTEPKLCIKIGYSYTDQKYFNLNFCGCDLRDRG